MQTPPAWFPLKLFPLTPGAEEGEATCSHSPWGRGWGGNVQLWGIWEGAERVAEVMCELEFEGGKEF